MRVGLSTAPWLAREARVDAILDRLEELAPDVVEVAAGGPEPLQLALLGALGARRDRLPLAALELFAPGPRPRHGPSLAAVDDSERRTALRLAERSIFAAAELGVELVVVSLGRVVFHADWPMLRRAFERRELDAQTVAGYQATRRAAAAAHLDAVRLALERLLRLAEVATVTLLVANPPGYDELADPDELAALLRDFAGAPVGTCYDTAAAAVQETLGTATAGAYLAAYGGHARLTHLADAAGLARALAPGVGELDFDTLARGLPETALGIIHCAPGVFPRELATALATLRRTLAAAGAAATAEAEPRHGGGPEPGPEGRRTP